MTNEIDHITEIAKSVGAVPLGDQSYFDGKEWKSCVRLVFDDSKLLAFEQKVLKQRDVETYGLKKQVNAYQQLLKSYEESMAFKVEAGVEHKMLSVAAEIKSLDSEREANALLTEELDQLRAKLAMQAELIDELWHSNSTDVANKKYCAVKLGTAIEVAAWEAKKKAEIEKAVLEHCAKYFDVLDETFPMTPPQIAASIRRQAKNVEV